MTANTRIPTHGEILALIDALPGRDGLLAALIYLSGLRAGDCVKLRVRDLGPGCIYRHDRHGMLRGIAMLPPAMELPLGEHLEACVALYEHDRAGDVVVEVPEGLYEGDDPAESWRWRYLFAGPLAGGPGGPPIRKPYPAGEFRAAFGRGLAAAGIGGAFSPQALVHAHRHHGVAWAIDDLNGSRPLAGSDRVVSLEARRARETCARALKALCIALSARTGARGSQGS